MNEDTIVLINEAGEEKEYIILLTFSSEEFNQNYVAFYEEGKEELYVKTYNPADGDSGMLGEIENDSEWEMVEEVIEAFLLEDASE